MIEIDIPTIDPMQHETKIFVGLTSRQCLCMIPGVIIGGILFVIGYGISTEMAVILCGLAIVPAACMGWYSPYNMKFEQYVQLVFFNTFVANPKRIYKTDNEQEVKLLTIKERQKNEERQKAQEFDQKKQRKSYKKIESKEEA